jgi:glycosyltransferase involved in cell wall biosynthesis
VLPKVSVSVVTFNHAAFLEEMFATVLSQKIDFPYEIVVGDDASTDETAAILERYAKQYPQIVVPIYHKTNIGPGRNFQSVLDRCQGQYIAHLDGDDCMMPGKLQKQVDILDLHPEFVMVVHDLDIVDDQRRLIDSYKTLRRVSTIKDLVRYGTYFGDSSKMYRRSAMPPEGLAKEIRFVGDWLFHIQKAAHGDIGFIPETLGIYRNHSGGLTKTLRLHEYQNDLNFTLRYCEKTLLPKNRITAWDLAYAKSRVAYFLAELCFSAGDVRQGRAFLYASFRSFPFYSVNPYLAFFKWSFPPTSLRLYAALKRWANRMKTLE